MDAPVLNPPKKKLAAKDEAKYRFLKPLAALKHAAPEQFIEFMRAFAPVVDLEVLAVVRCPVEDLPVRQGRAQAFVSLMEDFDTCTQLVQAFEEQMK